jgi:hypothetical protein
MKLLTTKKLEKSNMTTLDHKKTIIGSGGPSVTLVNNR